MYSCAGHFECVMVPRMFPGKDSSLPFLTFLLQNRDGPQPKPGDLIEIFSRHHTHWALYEGNGYVVHLTHVGKEGLSVENWVGMRLGQLHNVLFSPVGTDIRVWVSGAVSWRPISCGSLAGSF